LGKQEPGNASLPSDPKLNVLSKDLCSSEKIRREEEEFPGGEG
jgi:hypothetical protein